MSIVKSFRKAKVERRQLVLDYSCFLQEAERLTDFQVIISPYTETGPLSLDVGYVDADHKKLSMFAAGGIGNTSYVIQMVVRTDAGQTKRDDIGMRVTP
jgi:hypothetical protein